jgi:putative SOS response-associated peptidase YedK
MCGRYAITLPPEATRQIFQTHGELPNLPAYYNAAPTTALPVVRQAKDSGGRELALMQWGLIPWFSKDGKPSYSTINARAEGVQTAVSYREPFKTWRCIVPASGYFEWTGPKNDRQPHYFTRADGQPMGLAGLWDRWRSKDKSETKETFTIVTTEPSKFAVQFHNRMPLILEPESFDPWLKADPDIPAALMVPAAENVLTCRAVSKLINNVKNNSPELLTVA